MLPHWMSAGLSAAILCFTGCSEQAPSSKTEPPMQDASAPDNAWAWERMDAFGAMLNDEQKAHAEISAQEFIESGGDLAQRFSESAVLVAPIVDVSAVRYSQSLNCVAAYWIATEAGEVEPWHASNRIGSIVYVTFTSTPPPGEERHVSSETLTEFRVRTYTDYLIALRENRGKQSDDQHWAQRSVLKCDWLFPEPK